MPEETSLDTAIPPIGWQDGEREPPDQQPRRQPAVKKKKVPAEAPTPSRPDPAEGTGTNIDVTV